MRRVLTLAAMFLIGSGALAQVEPRMAGDWRSGEESLHLGADGRYQKSLNGQVTESGTIKANNGNWTLKSDTGRSDSGSFSFIAGNLIMHGGMSGSWSPSSSRQAATQAFPSHSVAPSNTPKSNPPSSTQSYNPPASEQSYTSTQSSQPYAAPPDSQPYKAPPISRPYKAPLISQPYKDPTNPNWTEGTSPDPQVRVAGPSYNNSQPLPAFPAPPFKPQMYVPGPPTYPPGYKPITNPRPVSAAPPGWRPPADHPNDLGPNQDSNGNWVERNHPMPNSVQYINARDIKPNGRGGNPSTFEQNAAAQWAQRGQAPGYQRVPQGGYIPVMKDGKARSFWRGF